MDLDEKREVLHTAVEAVMPEGAILSHGFVAVSYMDQEGDTRFSYWPVGHPYLEQTLGLLMLATQQASMDSLVPSEED